ncbi:hypothetical protein IJX73_05890 [bacterium]|nr:hypothetical protein [bacterium]
MEFIKYFNKNIAKIAPVAFVVLTLFISLVKIPFYDETQALIISRLDLSQMFQISRIEGHPILWYLILKPFNSFELYPYPMMIINWIFASATIFVLWKFAPFNNLVKFLITFSYPFFQYYGVVSRPYTLAVLVIFLLATLYKNSFKKPLLYSFLLVLCANISVISAFVAFGFGIVFIYEIFKNKLNKKDLVLLFLILFFGALILISQLCGFETPKMQSTYAHLEFIKELKTFLFNPFDNFFEKNINQNLLRICVFVSFYYFSFLFFKKDKKALILFLIPTALMITMFLFIYVGDFWHYHFVLITFIAVMWVSLEKIEDNKIVNILFVALILLNMTSFSISKDGTNKTQKGIFYSKALKILTQEKYKNAKLFCNDYYMYISPGLLYYLKKEGIIIYDIQKNDSMSFESIKNIRNASYHKDISLNLKKNRDKNKENYYIVISNNINKYKSYQYEENGEKIFFELVEAYPELYLLIYKINFET